MLVDVVKVSPSDELDSFEIGQNLPSVQSLQDGGGTTEIGKRLPSVQSLHDRGETIEIDYFCQQSNPTTKNEKIHSHKNKAIQRIEKDHGITRKILEQHFGMTLQDAAKNLSGKPCDSVMTLKVTYKGDIIKFQLPFSSTRVELKEEVEKRLKVSLERFSIKYEDEDDDDDGILITNDSDLRDGMHSLRLLGRNTMRLLVTPEAADT